jgi:hypothetical protein
VATALQPSPTASGITLPILARRISSGSRNRYHNGYLAGSDHDGYLYTFAGGCYTQHCTIADYVSPKPALVLVPTAELQQIGTAKYVIDPVRNALAKYDPRLQGLVPPQGVPSPVDIASLLPPAATERAARTEATYKLSSSAQETLRSLALAEQQNERDESAARAKLANDVARHQSLERIVGKLGELMAVTENQATINPSAVSAQIPLKNAQLVQLVSTKCFNCHGGAKTEAGVDFKEADRWGEDEWANVIGQVASGAMPRGGQKLTKDELALFKGEFKRVVSLAAR